VHTAGTVPAASRRARGRGRPNSGVFSIAGGKVRIANSIIRNNGQTAVWLVNGATGEASGTQMLGNDCGGVLAHSLDAATTIATVSDSIISGGTSDVEAFTASAAATARVTVAWRRESEEDRQPCLAVRFFAGLRHGNVKRT
jgi:hypothetical protein